MVRVKKDITADDSAASERLLLAALQLFNSKGYAATSVREIVAEAGVSKPVLYYYFGSKEGIYLALMEQVHARFQEVASRNIVASGSARDRIIGFITDMYDKISQERALVRLILSIYYGPPQGAPHFPHEQYFDAMLEIVAGMLQEGMESGELRRVDLQVASWSVISCLNTVMEERACSDTPRIDRDGLALMAGLVLDGIGNGGLR